MAAANLPSSSSQTPRLSANTAEGEDRRLFSESKIIISTKSPFLETLFHIVFLGKRTIYSLLLFSYLFSVHISLTVGESQIMYNNNTSSTTSMETFSQSSSTTRLNRKLFSKKADQSESIGESDENIEFVIQPTTPDPGQLLHVDNRSNEAKSAPIIASSFRTIDSQPTNSKEVEGRASPEEPSQKKKTRKCHRDSLKRCLEGLPPMNDTGLPSSHEAVHRACRIYDSGITCFDTWAKYCLSNDQRQHVKASITGAHEMYSFLCKDPKFRSDYLKHKDCYKQLSPYWDDCSRQFIEGLRSNSKNNETVVCCIRLEFITCVSKYSAGLCTLEATKFSMKMAETLIRTQTRTSTQDCKDIHPKQCIPITGAAHSLSLVATRTSFLLNFILLSLCGGMIGSGFLPSV